MFRYELKHDRFELRIGKSENSIPTTTPDEVFDAYLAGTANCPETLNSFATDYEALQALSTCSPTTSARPGVASGLLVGDLYYVELNEYDENGEFDQGGDILRFAAEGYISKAAREAEYKVRPAYWDEWYADGGSVEEYDPDKTITFAEIEWLAGEWDADIFKLLDEVEEV